MTATKSGTEVDTIDRRPLVHVPLDGPLADMDQAWRLAQAFAAADIVPTDLRGKPANVFLVMLYGQRLGLPPEISINTISVVKGRPRMAGQLLLAKVREAGHAPKIAHGDGECTVTITRGDTAEEHTETFTLEDAVIARLCTIKDGKPFARSKNGEPLPWECYPKRMLMWRALGFCVDALCPEIKMGFAVEGDEQPTEERPTLAQVAAERTDQPAASASVEPDQPVDEPEVDQADMVAELAAIEAEHVAEYGHGPYSGDEDSTAAEAITVRGEQE